MVAEGAFFHNPPHARRDFRGKSPVHALGKWLDEGIAVPPIKIPGLVWTGSLAIPAAYATGIDLTNDTRMIVHFSCRGWADRHAGRVRMAVHAGPREIAHFCVRKRLAIGNLKQLHPGDTAFLIRFIRPDRHIVFRRTGDRTCPATGAFVQINDHAIFIFPMLLFHSLPHSK
jgi:hypothetical protein